MMLNPGSKIKKQEKLSAFLDTFEIIFVSFAV